MKKSGLVGLCMMVAVIIAISIGLKYQENHKWVSADVTIVDNNGYSIPYAMVGLRTLDKTGYGSSSSAVNGRVLVGYVPKGDYELRVWFGDLDRVDRLLYSAKVHLERKNQAVYVALNNVTQKITILVAEPDVDIPSLEGKSIKIEPYRK